jgi:hypothetical protein
VDVLLIVDAVGLHDLLEVTLEHPGYLNRELLDAKGDVPGRFLLALPALLDGFRRLLTQACIDECCMSLLRVANGLARLA